jgi:hypothetical protein
MKHYTTNVCRLVCNEKVVGEIERVRIKAGVEDFSKISFKCGLKELKR